MMKSWLKDCNERHSDYKCTMQPKIGGPPPSAQDLDPMKEDDLEQLILRELDSRKPFNVPTRMIDVGAVDSPSVRLYETRHGDKYEDFPYIALSHRWGISTPDAPAFCTTPENKRSHIEHGIPLSSLPPTFRDAVITTRALGVRYLWIDSICIIQGDGGDFSSESKRMEDVFGAAYCVIAATRSVGGQWDGFLKPRPRRDYVAFEDGFYVCRSIDDFSGDVLDGELNNRGWVFQERALARRTIFFGENQMYFECGAGVRCETLTKMSK
jgi:hypothetical protein